MTNLISNLTVKQTNLQIQNKKNDFRRPAETDKDIKLK